MKTDFCSVPPAGSRSALLPAHPAGNPACVVFRVRELMPRTLARFSVTESYLGGAGIGGAGFLDMDDLMRRVVGVADGGPRAPLVEGLALVDLGC